MELRAGLLCRPECAWAHGEPTGGARVVASPGRRFMTERTLARKRGLVTKVVVKLRRYRLALSTSCILSEPALLIREQLSSYSSAHPIPRRSFVSLANVLPVRCMIAA
jgi:hypothetical protein